MRTVSPPGAERAGGGGGCPVLCGHRPWAGAGRRPRVRRPLLRQWPRRAQTWCIRWRPRCSRSSSCPQVRRAVALSLARCPEPSSPALRGTRVPVPPTWAACFPPRGSRGVAFLTAETEEEAPVAAGRGRRREGGGPPPHPVGAGGEATARCHSADPLSAALPPRTHVPNQVSPSSAPRGRFANVLGCGHAGHRQGRPGVAPPLPAPTTGMETSLSPPGGMREAPGDTATPCDEAAVCPSREAPFERPDADTPQPHTPLQPRATREPG